MTMYAVPLASQNRYTLTSAGWSKLASSRASLMKLLRPASKVSRYRSLFTCTWLSPVRDASELGMYSLSATRRCSEWSLAR